VGIHFFLSESESNGAQLHQTFLNRVAAERAALQRGEIAFADFLLSERLYCDLARLHYIFHRITPEHYRVRFDTRFYLAALPPEQRPIDAVEEVSESLWISPERALERHQAGNFPMMPPTLMVLRNLSAHRTWEEVRDAFDLR